MKTTSLIAALLLGFLSLSSHAQSAEWIYTDDNAYIPKESPSHTHKSDTLIIESAESVSSAKVDSNTYTSMITVNSPQDRIHISPNPSHGVFYLSHVRAGEKILVYDPLGQKVYEGIAYGEKYSIDLSWRGRGIYSYQILDEGGLVQMGKIVIE